MFEKEPAGTSEGKVGLPGSYELHADDDLLNDAQHAQNPRSLLAA